MAQVTRHDARLFGARRMISAPDRIVIACEHTRRLVVVNESLDIVGASEPLPAPAMDVVGSGSYYFVAGDDGTVHRLSYADTPVRDLSATIGDANPQAWIAASGSTILAGGYRGEIVAMNQSLTVTGRTIGLGRHVAAVVVAGFLYAFDGAGRVACIEIAGMVTRSIVNVSQAVDVVQVIAQGASDIVIACAGVNPKIITISVASQSAPAVTATASVSGTLYGVFNDGLKTPCLGEPYAIPALDVHVPAYVGRYHGDAYYICDRTSSQLTSTNVLPSLPPYIDLTIAGTTIGYSAIINRTPGGTPQADSINLAGAYSANKTVRCYRVDDTQWRGGDVCDWTKTNYSDINHSGGSVTTFVREILWKVEYNDGLYQASVGQYVDAYDAINRADLYSATGMQNAVAANNLNASLHLQNLGDPNDYDTYATGGTGTVAVPSPSAIADEETWEEVFDFTSGQGNFAPVINITDYATAAWSTNKWISLYNVDSISGDSEVRVFQETFIAGRLTHLEIEYDASLPGEQIRTPFGTETVTFPAGTGALIVRDGDVTTKSWRFDLFADNKNSSMAIKRITLRGLGRNPFRWETVATARITSTQGDAFSVALGTQPAGLYRLRYTGSGAGNGNPSVLNNWVALGYVYVDGVQKIAAEFPPGGNGARQASGSVVETKNIGNASVGSSLPAGVFDLRWPDAFPGPPNANQDHNSGPEFQLQRYVF